MTEAPPLDPDQQGFVAPGDTSAPEVQQIATLPQSQQADYFGFQRTERWFLPDGISYMELQAMNEGMKKEYQKRTRSDVTVMRGSGDAKFSVDPGEERWQLILQSVVGWNLLRNGQPVPLSTNSYNNKKNLEDWLTLADPKLVESLEQKIRDINPWLMSEMKVEDIDKEIERLQDLRKQAVERQAGEGSSASK
jgi:hypothetical protein